MAQPELFADATPDSKKSTDFTHSVEAQNVHNTFLTELSETRPLSPANRSAAIAAENEQIQALADYEVQERQRAIDLAINVYGASATNPDVIATQAKIKETQFHAATPGFI